MNCNRSGFTCAATNHSRLLKINKRLFHTKQTILVSRFRQFHHLCRNTMRQRYNNRVLLFWQWLVDRLDYNCLFNYVSNVSAQSLKIKLTMLYNILISIFTAVVKHEFVHGPSNLLQNNECLRQLANRSVVECN
jgi:hypothetical protein